MKGDFTRNTFDKRKHFSRVLWQQGRVQLDANFNEQTAILLHHQQALAADLIGPHGTPPPKVGEPELDGFKITEVSATDFKIGNGHYYVGGILCENDEKDEAGNFVEVTYKTQPDYPKDSALPARPYLVYLDVWERHISHLEDAGIIEVGLGVNRPDTATRAKVVWQVKAQEIDPNITACLNDQQWKDLVKGWQPNNRGLLKASAVLSTSTDLENPCITPPEARYRGAENQLYRVEIHKSGRANDGDKSATFKWSRDNGSIIFPVRNFAGETITLEYLGRDTHSSLEPGQWVELMDDDMEWIGLREKEINPLGKVTAVDVDQMTITVDWSTTTGLPSYEAHDYESKHVLLRRWDHTNDASIPGAPHFDESTGTLSVQESTDANTDKWLTLENGIQICFTQPKEGEVAHYYRAGDYWLIPARTATGDVEWPGTVDNPDALPPHGVEHHYAPLAIFPVTGNPLDCRKIISRGIDPNSDVTVHNLNVTGNVSGIYPENIGALAVRNYFRRVNGVRLMENTGNGDQWQIATIGFQPVLILANIWIAAFNEHSYIGTFPVTTILDEDPHTSNAYYSDCYDVTITKNYGPLINGSIGQERKKKMPDSLFYGRFQDLTTGIDETIEITIAHSSPPHLLTMTLHRIPEANAIPLDWFQIVLSLSCLG